MISQTAHFTSQLFSSFLAFIVVSIAQSLANIKRTMNFLGAISVKECGAAEREVYANEYSGRFGYQRLVFFPGDRVIGFYINGEMVGGAIMSENFDKITNRLDEKKIAEFRQGIEGKKCFMMHGLWVRPGLTKVLTQFIIFCVNSRIQINAFFGRYQAFVFDCLKPALHQKKYLPMNPDQVIENVWNGGPHWVYRLDINAAAYLKVFMSPIRKMLTIPSKQHQPFHLQALKAS